MCAVSHSDRDLRATVAYVQASSATSASASRSAEAASSPRAVAEQLAALLRILLNDPRSSHYAVVERHGLSITQVRTLSMLAAGGEPLPAGTLAERLGLSAPAMSRSLDALVRYGLAHRRESDEDRRVRLISLSEEGAALTAELSALKTADIERIVAELEPEQRLRLGEALDEILDAEVQR